MADNTLEQQIADAATQPKTYENDGERIENHSLPDLIKADEHLAKRRAARNPWGAIAKVRISTQGPEK